jgi:mannose-6-phosphate isomerase-like protein (cupin superfamily)
MSRRAFFIAGDHVFHIANPCGAGLGYHAQAHVVMPGAQVAPQFQEQAETIILVEDGVLEVMINGMTGWVRGGDFIRIPASTWYAYRNDTDDPTRILCRTAPVQRPRESCRITIHIAAA